MNLIFTGAAADASAQTGGQGSMLMLIVWIVIFFVIMYFMMIRPQRKEQKKKEMMLNEMAEGDTVLTTSGFYGTLIDIADDTVVVEFGNNKNCRIPMQREAVAAVEKPEDSVKEAVEDKREEKKEEKKKKSLFAKKDSKEEA